MSIFMARGRELSQLGSLINIEDSTQNIGVAAATPSQKIGIGTNSPTSKVEVVGDVFVSGIITATSFVGDGSGLIGVASTDNIVTGTAATFNNTVNINEQLEVNNINVSGTSTISGLTYPSSDGSENFVLKTDGSGNLSFASVSSLSATTFEWSVDNDLGLIEDAVTENDDNGLITDDINVSYDLGIFVSDGIIYPGQFVLPQFTVSSLPTAVVGGMIFVTDETGGSIPAFSDGTNWRRVTDRAIVS